jgi:hypothetical protein
VLEVVALISLAAAAVLILRKTNVSLSLRLLWCLIALATFAAPTLALAVVDAVAPRWPFRPILGPFVVISEFLIPWIVFAIYNEKTDPVGTDSPQVSS